MKNKILMIITALFAPYAYSDTTKSTEGKIEELTSYLSTHSTVGVHNIVDFKLDVALETPCTRLHLSKDEDEAISIILSAKARGSNLRVYYYTDRIGAWSTTNCEVYAVREM